MAVTRPLNAHWPSRAWEQRPLPARLANSLKCIFSQVGTLSLNLFLSVLFVPRLPLASLGQPTKQQKAIKAKKKNARGERSKKEGGEKPRRKACVPDNEFPFPRPRRSASCARSLGRRTGRTAWIKVRKVSPQSGRPCGRKRRACRSRFSGADGRQERGACLSAPSQFRDRGARVTSLVVVVVVVVFGGVIVPAFRFFFLCFFFWLLLFLGVTVALKIVRSSQLFVGVCFARAGEVRALAGCSFLVSCKRPCRHRAE